MIFKFFSMVDQVDRKILLYKESCIGERVESLPAPLRACDRAMEGKLDCSSGHCVISRLTQYF